MKLMTWAIAAFASALCIPSLAQAAQPEVFLSLADVQRLAVERQPALEAQAQAVAAARNSAVAAAQLPDPKLTAGVTDLPVDGADRYSLRRDDFTMFTAGVMQDFPRAAKRQLRGQKGEHEAELAEQTLATSRLMIERDAGFAWLAVWKAERLRELLLDAAHQADLQMQAAEIAYTTNTAPQSAVLESQVNAALLRDEAADADLQVRDARDQLSRWLGNEVADRSVSPEVPTWPDPPDLPQLLVQLRQHPHLNAEAKRVELAEDEVALARQAYKPDWSLAVDYGYRPDFADFVSVNVTVDLPVFSHSRQDRELSAKLAEQEQAELQREDMFREQESDIRRNWEALRRQQERLKQFDNDILPKSRQRIDSALATWQSGQGGLMSVLDARRMALDNEMKRLELLADAAKRQINLQYYAGKAS